MNTYDTFIPNILEMQGKIERKAFNFIGNNCKIWQKGVCVAELNSTIQISAKIDSSGEAEVSLNNSELSNYISDNFSFSEISLNHDRVLWSNNLMSGGAGANSYEPTTMSLFYYRGVLSRIYINVISPTTLMIEITSGNTSQISDVENPFKKFLNKS